jgi:hypothetical protein
MSQLSRVVVQTMNPDGSELLEHHTFLLADAADAADAPLARGLPLTHAFRAPRDKDSTVRVLARGLGVVDGSERELVEAQKTTRFVNGKASELELYFAQACFQKFCRTELRGSSETCAGGRCIGIPSADEPTAASRDPSDPATAPLPLDAGVAQDASVHDAGAAVVGDEIDAGVVPATGTKGDCDGAVNVNANCLCTNGALPPCDPAPLLDAGQACDVGNHQGTLTGKVGQSVSTPNTPISGTFSFEVPAPGASNVVAIVQGALSGTTANGSTMVARVEGRWNCTLRSLEMGAIVDGVYTYAERILNNKVAFSGTASGSYAAGAQSASGEWKIVTESNTGGFGTWSTR